MGLLVQIASAPVGALIYLLIIIGLVVLNFWAMSRIITQAGYSPAWILLPIAPFVLTFISYIILWHDLHTIAFGGSLGDAGINNGGTVWYLDLIAIFLNWIFYLVFAFSRWPVSGTQHSHSVDGPRPPDTFRTTPGPTPVPSAPAAAPSTARVLPQSAAGPGAGPAAAPSAPVPKGPSAQFCAWCGESLPGNRALFHDCGSKDRPETFCKNCGTALPTGSSVCGSCGAG